MGRSGPQKQRKVSLLLTGVVFTFAASSAAAQVQEPAPGEDSPSALSAPKVDTRATPDVGDSPVTGDEGVDDKDEALSPPSAPLPAPTGASGARPGEADRLGAGDIGEDILEIFVLERGFYLASELGVFFTLGGTQGYSNLQPFMAIKAGYDLGDYFGLQASLSTAYVSGNPPTSADLPGRDPRGINNFDATGDFGLFNLGLEAVVALRPTQRLAIEPKVGGGYSFIDPPLTDPAAGAPPTFAKHSPHGGHVTAGVDIKYLTLLTGFSAGASVNFFGFLGGHGFIPAIAVAATVRYTL